MPSLCGWQVPLTVRQASGIEKQDTISDNLLRFLSPLVGPLYLSYIVPLFGPLMEACSNLWHGLPFRLRKRTGLQTLRLAPNLNLIHVSVVHTLLHDPAHISKVSTPHHHHKLTVIQKASGIRWKHSQLRNTSAATHLQSFCSELLANDILKPLALGYQ